MKLPNKLPRWYKWEEYDDLFSGSSVILRMDYNRCKVLLAPKYFRTTRFIFRIYDRLLFYYWKTIRTAIRNFAKKGWLKPVPGELMCWASIKKWRKSAVTRH